MKIIKSKILNEVQPDGSILLYVLPANAEPGSGYAEDGFMFWEVADDEKQDKKKQKHRSNYGVISIEKNQDM